MMTPQLTLERSLNRLRPAQKGRRDRVVAALKTVGDHFSTTGQKKEMRARKARRRKRKFVREQGRKAWRR